MSQSRARQVLTWYQSVALPGKKRGENVTVTFVEQITVIFVSGFSPSLVERRVILSTHGHTKSGIVTLTSRFFTKNRLCPGSCVLDVEQELVQGKHTAHDFMPRRRARSSVSTQTQLPIAPRTLTRIPSCTSFTTRAKKTITLIVKTPRALEALDDPMKGPTDRPGPSCRVDGSG